MDERKRALVVGINAYGGGIPSLGSAVRDAEEIARQLELAHGYEVDLLRDAEATVTSIIGSLTEVAETGLSEESSFVLYYAGHGIAADDSDGTGPQGYLLAHDAELWNQDTWLGMNSLRDALDGLACRHLMMVLDCCYAGAFRWSSTRSVGVVKRPLYRSQYERYRDGVAWQVLTSASYDEKADDAAPVTPDRGDGASPEGHSPFALALIEGLSGNAADSSRGGMAADGVLTATELYQFIYEKVAVNDRQTPGIFPLKHDNKGEFVFLAPGIELNLEPDPPLDDGNNPWLGLDAYSAADQDLFFGREEATEELLARVEAGGLVALVGASGSGKSSLIQAGLIPSLDRSEWTIVAACVTGDPAEQLSAAQEKLAQTPDGGRRLLVIDQFEQLFTQSDDSIREGFIGAVRDLLGSEDNPTVLIGLRSDYEPRAASELGDLWTDRAKYAVPDFKRPDSRDTRDELLDVILGPAQAKAVFFEPATLVDALLAEVAKTPGPAPLLSLTLASLYRQAQARRRESGTADRMLSAEDYDAIGGVVGVVHQRAHDLYDGADDAGRSTLRRLILRLVEQDTDGLKRRRVNREELRFGAEHEQLVVRTVDVFVAARLLVVGSDGDREYVEPAHDALVTTWNKQLEWLAQSGSQQVVREAWVAANDWTTEDRRRKASKYLWTHNPHLLELERREHEQELNALEQEFRAVSSRRRKTVTLRLIGAAVLFVLGLVAGLYFTTQAKNDAVDARKQEVVAKNDAVTARNEAVDAKNDAVTARNEAVDAKNDAVTARNEAVDAKNDAVTARNEAVDAKNDAVTARNEAVAEKQRALEGLFKDLTLNIGAGQNAGSICVVMSSRCTFGRPIDGLATQPANVTVLGELTEDDVRFFGPGATPTSQAFVVSSEWGSGRVVAYGHDGLIRDVEYRNCDASSSEFEQCSSELPDGVGADNLTFTDNALRWARNGNACGADTVSVAIIEGWEDVATTREIAGLLNKRGWNYVGLDPDAPLAPQLECINVVIWGNQWWATDQQLRDVVLYVENGGGLLLGGLGWAWVDNIALPLTEYPSNRLAAYFGFAFTNDSFGTGATVRVLAATAP